MQQRYRLRPILNVTITGALWGEHVPKTPFGNGRVQCSGQPDATNYTHRGRHAAAMRLNATITVAICFIFLIIIVAPRLAHCECKVLQNHTIIIIIITYFITIILCYLLIIFLLFYYLFYFFFFYYFYVLLIALFI